jgi:hypothetical protein
MTERSTALAPPGTAAADLLRLEAAAVPEPLSQKAERAIRKLRPYEGWEARMESLIRTCSEVPGAPNPSSWEPSTASRHPTVIRYILETCDAAGLPINDFHDLQSLATLDALKARLRPRLMPAEPVQGNTKESPSASNAAPLKQTWGGVYLRGIMCSLQTCLHAAGIASSTELNARIAFYATAERRSVDDRLFLKETYLRGATALDAFGRIAQAAGKASGFNIRTGARLLAVAVDGGPRRGELAQASRRHVHQNALAASPEVKVFIRRATSKAKRTRILWLRDPRAIRLMADLCKGPGGHDLLRKEDGRPISVSMAYILLRRVTVMALGKPASFNILRRANAYAQRTTAGRSVQLGRSLKSTQTDAIYHPDMVCRASAALAAGRARARAAAVRAGYLPSGGDIVNDLPGSGDIVNDQNPQK